MVKTALGHTQGPMGHGKQTEDDKIYRADLSPMPVIAEDFAADVILLQNVADAGDKYRASRSRRPAHFCSEQNKAFQQGRPHVRLPLE